MRASWLELFRHFTVGGVDPFEVRRRAIRCTVRELSVLDLTNPEVQLALGSVEDDLTGDDYGACQRLADAARTAQLDGVLAPSAALAGQRTLAVFGSALDDGRVTIEADRVQVPPIDLVKLLPRVRAVPAVAAAFEVYAADLARRSYEAVRRRYRRR